MDFSYEDFGGYSSGTPKPEIAPSNANYMLSMTYPESDLIQDSPTGIADETKANWQSQEMLDHLQSAPHSDSMLVNSIESSDPSSLTNEVIQPLNATEKIQEYWLSQETLERLQSETQGNYFSHCNPDYPDVVRAPCGIGNPLRDRITSPGSQERIDSCAIHAQQHILKVFGIDISEADLVKEARLHGEYKHGVSGFDIGNLLDRHGVKTHRYHDATIVHLISELSQGHMVIVAVDSSELMASTESEIANEIVKDMFMEEANHVVVVSGINAHTLDVSFIDPADGKLHTVSASQFMDACQDSDCLMVATNDSPEKFIYAKKTRVGNPCNPSTKLDFQMPSFD